MYCTFPFSRNTNLRFRFIRVSILFHFISFLSSSFGESNSEACDKGVIIFQLQSLKRVVCGKYSSFFLAVVCFFFLFIPLKCLVCGTFKDKNISGISRQKRNKNQNVSTDVVPWKHLRSRHSRLLQPYSSRRSPVGSSGPQVTEYLLTSTSKCCQCTCLKIMFVYKSVEHTGVWEEWLQSTILKYCNYIAKVISPNNILVLITLNGCVCEVKNKCWVFSVNRFCSGYKISKLWEQVQLNTPLLYRPEILQKNQYFSSVRYICRFFCSF